MQNKKTITNTDISPAFIDSLALGTILTEFKNHTGQTHVYSKRVQDLAYAEAPFAAKLTRTLKAPLAGAVQLGASGLYLTYGAIQGAAGIAMLPFGNKTLIKSAGKNINTAMESAQRGVSSILQGVLTPIQIASQAIAGLNNKEKIDAQGHRLEDQLGIGKNAWKYYGLSNHISKSGHVGLGAKTVITRDAIPELRNNPNKVKQTLKDIFSKKNKPISNELLDTITKKVNNRIDVIDKELQGYITKDPNGGALNHIFAAAASDAEQKKAALKNPYTYIFQSKDHITETTEPIGYQNNPSLGKHTSKVLNEEQQQKQERALNINR